MDRTPERDRELDPKIPRGTDESEQDARQDDAETANPPHTTTGKVTSPKFGSAGSGGLEYEGSFDRD